MNFAVAVLALIFGTDTRLDVYEVEDHTVRQLAERSVALIYGDFAPKPLSERIDLCPEERFVDQPALAACSGVLIDEQHVLTASHCVRECAGLRLVRNFVMIDASEHAAVELYSCVEVLARDEELDTALVLIDRPVAGLERAAIVEQLVEGEPLFAVGHPLGLPVKIDLGGRVEDGSKQGSFTAALDLYQGSSGSAVYNARLELAGVAIRGQSDFELDRDALCLRSRTSTVGGEVIARASRVWFGNEEDPRGCRCVSSGKAAGVWLLFGLLFLIARVRPIRCTRACHEDQVVGIFIVNMCFHGDERARVEHGLPRRRHDLRGIRRDQKHAGSDASILLGERPYFGEP